MNSVSFYDPLGRVTSSVSGDAAAIAVVQATATEPYVLGDHYGKLVYVEGGEVKLRPKSPVTLEGMTLHNVPVTAIVHVRGQSFETDEPTVELEFVQPGTYEVRVEAWPYLDKEFTIENPN